jgi:hypothetical protein
VISKATAQCAPGSAKLCEQTVAHGKARHLSVATRAARAGDVGNLAGFRK